MKEINQNYIKVSGIIIGPLEFSHEVHGIKMYEGIITVKRDSGINDNLPFVIPENMIPENFEDCYATITGEIRTHNKLIDNKSKLFLNIFVKEITINENQIYENEVELEGFLCKEPIYRETPSGRAICDLLLAVNRAYHKSNYIPTICWNTTALNARDLPVGTKIIIHGRFQSREYNKNGEIRTAYELSANSVSEEINTLPDEFEPLEEIDL